MLGALDTVGSRHLGTVRYLNILSGEVPDVRRGELWRGGHRGIQEGRGSIMTLDRRAEDTCSLGILATTALDVGGDGKAGAVAHREIG